MQVSSVNEPFKRSLDFPHPFSSPGIKPCWFSKPVYASMWATSWLVIAVWDDFCEIFQFWCPLRFQNSSLILPVRRFPIVWKFLLHDSLPKMSLSPQILCLPFHFYFLSYFIPKRLVCLSGYLGSSTSIQKIFCGSCSTCRLIFWCICRGESDLPILFLCHVGTALPFSLLHVSIIDFLNLIFIWYYSWLGLLWWLNGKEFACQTGDLNSIPGSGKSSGEENGNPLQYSCLENSMEIGVWQAVVHGVTKS